MSGNGRRTWGWHPLDDTWAERVVDAARVRPGELVLDIGAGHGALTGPLLDAGARVLAVELHAGRADRLRRRFAERDVTVIEADATELRLPRRPFRVVANPPYGISTAVLARLLARGSGLVAADIVLQRAVVNRFVMGRPFGTTRWQRRFDADLGLRLPRKAFHPPPKVDSAVLVLRPTGLEPPRIRPTRGNPGRVRPPPIRTACHASAEVTAAARSTTPGQESAGARCGVGA